MILGRSSHCFTTYSGLAAADVFALRERHEIIEHSMELKFYLPSSAPDFAWALIKANPDFTTDQYALAIKNLFMTKAIVDYDCFGVTKKFFLFEVDLNRHDIPF